MKKLRDVRDTLRGRGNDKNKGQPVDENSRRGPKHLQEHQRRHHRYTLHRTKSDAQHSSQEVGPTGGDPYSPQPRRASTSEPDQRHFSLNEPFYSPSLLPPTMYKSWPNKGQYDIAPKRTGPTTQNGPFELGPGIPLPPDPNGLSGAGLPPDLGGFSGTLQGPDSQRRETYKTGGSATRLSEQWGGLQLQRTENRRPREDGGDARAATGGMHHQLREEYESLRASFNELTQRSEYLEARVSELVRENEREKDKHETAIAVLRSEHATREHWHEEKIKRIHEDNQSIIGKWQEWYKSQIQGLEEKLDAVKKRHEGEMNELREGHREQMDQSETAHREETTRWRIGYEDQVSQLQETLRTTKDNLVRQLRNKDYEHQGERRRMESASKAEKEGYETELANLRNQNDVAKQKMEATRDTMERASEQKFATMERKMKAAEEKHNQDIEEMKRRYGINEKKMQEKFDAEKAGLEIKRVEENQKLREDVEALKAALVKRDHFKAMSDHELATRFQDLVREIDAFSRFEWDLRRELTWPFPGAIIRMSENERRAKQYLIQNTVWVIFYEKIFCTPFRVLGEEGKSLEQKWTEKYGDNQDVGSSGELALCPKPNRDSEKWRYETMKNCHEAISQPRAKWEPGYNLKIGYESSLEMIINDISQELGRVTSVSSSDQQKIGDIVRKAAKLWLDVGQQRYRIFLLMSESNEKPARSGQASVNGGGKQELIVEPQLRRMGNAQGERIDRDEIVSNCRGKFHVFRSG